MPDRYFVRPPIEGGDAWWLVNDRLGHLIGEEDNFTIASFSKKLPRAEREARGLCDRLNHENRAELG